MRKFSRGDFVIFDEVPSHRTADPQGEDSESIVQHFLTVRECSKKGTVVLQTPGGRMHVTRNTDPCLRRAHWWERLLYRDRFPRLDLTDRR